MTPISYVLIPSHFGTLGMLWQDTPEGPRVQQIFLPNEMPSSFAALRPASCPPIADLASRMEAYLEGQVASLSLDLLQMELCGDFQRRVLLAEYDIPRGSVSTYGRIAGHIHAPRAARAVGTALGHNPFPIIIPCHRAVRADGSLGGYRGGLPMKRVLLEMEGIAFGPDNKVRVAEFHY